jgi:hypothetical protein
MAGAEKMKTPWVFVFALAVVLFACASPAAASDETISGTRYVGSGEIFTINSGDTLTIAPTGTLIVNNSGTINNHGIIYNSGNINNCGTINNEYFIYNRGTINNCGTINNSFIITNDRGTINNCDTIANNGGIYNLCTINNYEGGIISGNSPYPNPVINLSLPCPFSCPCEEVPALPAFTTTGLIALVGLLSALAGVTIVRKRR